VRAWYERMGLEFPQWGHLPWAVSEDRPHPQCGPVCPARWAAGARGQACSPGSSWTLIDHTGIRPIASETLAHLCGIHLGQGAVLGAVAPLARLGLNSFSLALTVRTESEHSDRNFATRPLTVG